jgi:hypothetical protein
MNDTQGLAAFAAIVAVLSLDRIGRATLYVIFMWAIVSTTVGALITGAWRAAIPFGLVTVVTAWNWYRLSQADFAQQPPAGWTDLGIGRSCAGRAALVLSAATVGNKRRQSVADRVREDDDPPQNRRSRLRKRVRPVAWRVPLYGRCDD